MASWKRFFSRTARRSRALGLGVTLALAGAALLAPGGCTLDRQGLSAGGGGSGPTSTPSTTSTSTATASASTTGCSGAACPCVGDADCGAATNDGCVVKTCLASVCTPKDTTGLPTATQMKNDCKKSVCGANGMPVIVNDDTDLPPEDGNPCTDKVCMAGAPTAMNLAKGTVCLTTGTCDGNGACNNCKKNSDCTVGTLPTCDTTKHACISCSDGITNGLETAQDCGGNCGGCKNSDPCVTGNDCTSKQCFDGLCCNMACGKDCMACNLVGFEGVCSNLPIGVSDPACPGGMTICNGGGMCKKAAGIACGNDGDCASNACLAGFCRIETGGACSADLTCASGLCAGTVCVDCAANADCPSMQCNTVTGVCKTPGGAVCDADAECAIGVCMPFRICQVLSGSCGKAADCRSGVCKGGACVPCAGADKCSGNATCGSAPFGPNTCTLAAGDYCFNDGQCTSGDACSGYPATCQ